MKCRDGVYLCFAYISVFFIAAGLLEILPLDQTTYQVLGMVVGIPAAMFFLAAGVFGIGATLVCVREWPTLLMSVSFFSLCVLFFISESITAEEKDLYSLVFDSVTGLAVLLIVFLSARHFFLKNKE